MAEKNVSELDSPGLKAELLELRKEQFNLRMQRSTGQLANPSRFKAVRRQIARIKTRMVDLNRTVS
jgi:large subunit ribosomal protein L29